MAMTLRLSDEQAEALRQTAERENRSMQQVAVSAIEAYTSAHARKRAQLIQEITTKHASLLDRLGKA